MMSEWGIFNDDSDSHDTEQAVEADFYSRAEAEAALANLGDDSCYVHVCERTDEDDD